ncbi:hypothetical protein [Streptomyces sp. NPDC048252]|uniref:hypothetical protein n=1 Tax=Streptomyces sp. NPDC048252 TaxID=3154612 RepID=UPI0034137BA5
MGAADVCRAVPEVGEHGGDAVAVRSAFAFAPAAEAVLRPLIDGRSVGRAALADTAGLASDDVPPLPDRV